MPQRRNPNRLLQLVHQRVDRLCKRLTPRLWREVGALPVSSGETHEQWIDLAAAQREEHRPLAPGTYLGSGWKVRWCRVEVPAGEEGRQLLWQCQGESIVWNGAMPWAGIDVYHPSCPVVGQAHTLWIQVATWQTGWTPSCEPLGPQGARFDGCVLRLRDDQVGGSLADLDVLRQLMYQWFKEHGLEMPSGVGLCPALDDINPALRILLGLLDAACDAFDHEGLPALAGSLQAIRQRFPAASWQTTMAVVPFSHLDLVYLWPEKVAELKGVHTCATQLRLLDRYPEFRFSHSQPLSYLAIARRAPELMPQIRQRIAEGRWEVVGALATEIDTNLPCGEAIFRNLRIGQAITTELSGAPSRVCWLPDVFGYNACLPALLRLADVELFFTTKLSWSGLNRFPFSSFRWLGHDGTPVLAHLWHGSDTGQVGMLVQASRNFREAHIHPVQLASTGIGDGGGGPTSEMIEMISRLDNLATVPRCRFSRADAFADELKLHAGELPEYQGELYLECHRGVLTSQQRFKAACRHLEQGLQAWEAVRCAIGGGAIDRHPWERLCLAQFHDGVTGTSVPLVYEEGTPELQELSRRCLASAQAELGAGELPFNVLPFPRLVWSGQDLWQLGALGTGIRLPSQPVATTADLLDNGPVQARFRAGRLCALVIDGEMQPISGSTFTLAEDNPAYYDAWEVSHEAVALAEPVSSGATEVIAAGHLRSTGRLGAASTLTVHYRLMPGERHLRLDVEVDWNEEHRLLRFELDTTCQGASARFGCPFGSLLRPQQSGSQIAEAMWEVPGSRWAAALRDDGTGVALLAASNWGFSCRNGRLGVSLLRAPTNPDPASDRGHQSLRLAVGAHVTHFAEGRLPTAAAAESLWAPLLSVGRAIPPLELGRLGSLVPAWACPVADGLELRLHEVSGGVGALAVEACPVDALGRRGQVQARHPYGAYGILSLFLAA